MDDNKAIRFGIVIGLISLFSLGAYVVMKSFKSPDPVAMNDDPVDFSGPLKKITKGKRTPASAPGAPARPAQGGRSYGGDSGSSYEAPRIDAGSDGGSSAGSFFSPEGQDVVPLDTAAAGNAGSNGGGSDSPSGERAPASNDSAGGSSSSGIFGGLGNLLGSSGSGTSGSTSSGGSSGGGIFTPSPTPTPTPSPTGISAGTTGGGAFVGETANHFKASVSIGVPLSGVSGTTTGGGNYRYQVNLSGQQAQ